MAILKKHHNKDYTVVDNSILKDMTLSNSTIGLMCKMLSLPDGWKFSEKGLTAICKDGITSIKSSLHELEAKGYLFRTSVRTGNKISGIVYDLYEEPNIDRLKANKNTSESNRKTNFSESLESASLVSGKLILENKYNIINNNKVNKDIPLAKANEAELQAEIDNYSLDLKEDLDEPVSFLDKNKNSRNLKILMEYIAENFISDEVKQSIIDWLKECYEQKKTFTLKQLDKELEYLTSNCSDKEELLDIVYKTTQSKWATFRYVIENRDKQKQFNQKNNKQAVRTTEQKVCGEFMAL